MSYDAQEWFDWYKLFELENHAPDWPLYKSPEAVVLLRNKAGSFGGLPSISHYLRAFAELKASGSISQLRQPKPIESDEPDELTVEVYRSLPTRTIIQKYRNNEIFRAGVDSLIARKLI